MPIKTQITPEYHSLLNTLITANHILHHYGLVDAFGHISIRHPHDPSLYIIPGYVAPALVRSPDDLIEYHVSDSSPYDPQAPKGYSERFIHGEIFKRWPGINCVIHSHSEAVISFVVANVPMRPIFHMAGFLGSGAPVFDITASKYYHENPGHQKDMLVNNSDLGTALADCYAGEGQQKEEQLPEHLVVLMRHHGFTAVGESIQDALYRANYTQANARIYTNAALLKNASGEKKSEEGVKLDFLTEEEAKGCRKMNENTADKAFRMWIKEVETGGLYVNELREH